MARLALEVSPLTRSLASDRNAFGRPGCKPINRGAFMLAATALFAAGFVAAAYLILSAGECQ